MKICRAAWDSPHPLIAAPPSWQNLTLVLGCLYKPCGHRGGHLGSCGYHRWSPGHQVEPKPCLSQTLTAEGSFQNLQAAPCSSSVGFILLGELLYSRRTQVLRGKCRGKILQAAARHGLLKLIGGRSSMEEFHGFWSILK